MAYNPYDPYNQGIGTIDLGQYGLQQPEENMTVAEAINYGMLPQAKEKFEASYPMGFSKESNFGGNKYTGTTKGDFFDALQKGTFGMKTEDMFGGNINSLFEGVADNEIGTGWTDDAKPSYKRTGTGFDYSGTIDVPQKNLNQDLKDMLPGGFFKSIEDDQTSLVNEYGYPKMASLSGAVPKRVSTTEDIDIDSLRNPFESFQNEMVGPNPHDPSVYDPYGNIQMGLENPDVDPYEEQKGLAALFQNFNIDPSSWGKALKTKAKTGWNFAQQLPGMALGALTGIPGIGALMGNIRKDTPYEKFQKQTFADMGWGGDPNKDPWGKNIRSLKGGYDVRGQFDDLAGSKIGQKYGYAEAMADGVISNAELAAMQGKGLKGWQLDRVTGLAKAKAKADAYHDKINAALALKEKQKEDRKNRGYKPGDNTMNWDPNIKGTTSFNPSQGGKYQGGNYGNAPGTKGGWGPGAKKDGGRVRFANGGLATLFTRRG